MASSSTKPDTSAETNDAELTRASIAEAIAKRAVSLQPEDEEERRFALERDTRQEFRRLLDPGIARGTSESALLSTLKMLSTIAENLLRDPGNEKYQRFKPTNALIKQHLVEAKGALEYAIALGFRAEVVHFQPYYSFHSTPKNMDNLRIGASVLKEAVDRINQKHEQAKLNKVDPKAVQKQIAQKVKLAYEDDRKEKKRRGELEKQVREARAAAAAAKKAAGPFSPKSPTKGSSSMNNGEDAEKDDDEDEEYHEDGHDGDELMSILPVQPRMMLRGGRTVGDKPATAETAEKAEEMSED